MRRRHYAETTQALALYWLKTVREKGYTRDEWEALNGMILGEVHEHERGSAVDFALADLQRWTWAASELSHSRHSRRDGSPRVQSDDIVPYAMRLLNEWAPVEVSRLLIEEADDEDDRENGIPAIAKARAIERILRRDRVSNEYIEALLHPGLLSPRFFYPGDFEILQDVALYLLGRTEAPALPVLPAALLAVAPGTHLGSNYDRAVEEAFIAESPQGEALHVPIARARAMAALSGDTIQFTSFVVTLDGRLWRTHKFQGGDDHNVVIYHPAGSLRIDYSGDHACFHLPWYEERREWDGVFDIAPKVWMFGREWYGARWNQDSDGITVDFVFARCLRANELGLTSEASLHRSHPASVDIAWSALETALASENAADAIEDLHREDMIPLARAILALIESVRDSRHLKLELIESRVRAVAYFGSSLAKWYGPVRWHLLPEKVRSTLLWPKLYGAIAKSLHEVFDGVPEKTGGVLDTASWLRRLTRRSKAA